MKKFLGILILAISASSAQAQTVEVDCWTQIDGQRHAVTLKLNAQGEIIYWAKNQIAKADKSSIFGPLAENIKEWGFEYINSFKAPNGYSIIQAGTTADEINVGVSKDLTKGFYSYRDLGSGNGNSKLTLICLKK